MKNCPQLEQFPVSSVLLSIWPSWQQVNSFAAVLELTILDADPFRVGFSCEYI